MMGKMNRPEIFDIRKQKRRLSIKRAQGGRGFVYLTNRTFLGWKRFSFELTTEMGLEKYEVYANKASQVMLLRTLIDPKLLFAVLR